LETFLKLGLGVRAVAAAGARLTAAGSCVFSSAAGGPAELRPSATLRPELAPGRRAQPPGIPNWPAGRGWSAPRALFSEPEDTIRPSNQLSLHLTDGLRISSPGRTGARKWREARRTRESLDRAGNRSAARNSRERRHRVHTGGEEVRHSTDADGHSRMLTNTI
jgi:hypothetical protein